MSGPMDWRELAGPTPIGLGWMTMKPRSMNSAGDKPKKDAHPKDKKKPDAAFDLWLERGLHQMFDDVAREPVPDDLLRLIEGDRNK